MRLTPFLKSWIDETVTEYSKQLSIAKPRYILKVSELLSLPIEITEERRTSAYRYNAVTYLKHNLIFLNVKGAESRPKLRKTIAHECVHLRFPYLRHGSKFRRIVSQVIKGRQFPAYRPRKRR